MTPLANRFIKPDALDELLIKYFDTKNKKIVSQRNHKSLSVTKNKKIKKSMVVPIRIDPEPSAPLEPLMNDGKCVKFISYDL